MSDASNETPDSPQTGLLAFLYHLSFDEATKAAVKQANGLETLMQQFDLPNDVQLLFSGIEKSGQIRETDRVMIAALLSAYVVEHYEEVYQGIW